MTLKHRPIGEASDEETPYCKGDATTIAHNYFFVLFLCIRLQTFANNNSAMIQSGKAFSGAEPDCTSQKTSSAESHFVYAKFMETITIRCSVKLSALYNTPYNSLRIRARVRVVP